MTQYLLSVHGSDEEVLRRCRPTTRNGSTPGRRVQRRAPGRRLWVFGGGLKAELRDRRERRSGDPIMTDGPFAETKEQLGGFWILEPPDLDAALAWAAKARPPAWDRSRSVRSRTSELSRDRAGRRRHRARTDLP